MARSMLTEAAAQPQKVALRKEFSRVSDGLAKLNRTLDRNSKSFDMNSPLGT